MFMKPGIDSEESNSPAYVAWRSGTTNRVVVLARQAGNRFLDSLKGLQIRAQRKILKQNQSPLDFVLLTRAVKLCKKRSLLSRDLVALNSHGNCYYLAIIYFFYTL